MDALFSRLRLKLGLPVLLETTFEPEAFPLGLHLERFDRRLEVCSVRLHACPWSVSAHRGTAHAIFARAVNR